MSHHHHAEEKSYDKYYYLVGLLSGLFTGVVIDHGFVWIAICGIMGLLLAAIFIKLAVRGRVH